MKTVLKGALLAPALLALAAPAPADVAAGQADVAVAADAAPADEVKITVTAERLKLARNSLSPKSGGSLYRFDAKDIAALPEGADTSFNQVLLQAPGVANDSFGQLHIRGDHGNLQYRINGVILPEGISGFGQSLDTRFAKRIDLMTGALPAQYGYRTAGVVEIDTKTRFAPGGRVDFYGGSHGTGETGFEYGNSRGNLSYYLTGSALTDDLGIENPSAGNGALHDRTRQTKGFGYLSYLLDPDTQLSLMFGSYQGRFQIPDSAGQTPDPDGKGYLAGAGVSGFDSATVDERQRENNRYGIVSLQGSAGPDFDYQVDLFSRYTNVRFSPDPIGDLVFDGIASNVYRSSFSNGVQGDGSYRLNARHTLRVGLFASSEAVRSDNNSTVFPVDAAGTVVGAPFAIADSSARSGNTLLGLYLQDEWRASGKLKVNVGARLDRLDAYTSAGQLSPRLGLVYQATPETAWHAAYARYFTPPPTELVSSRTLALFANTSNAAATNLNDQVQPERSHYLDLGVSHQLTKALSLGVDSFYKRVDDMLDEGQFGQALIFSPFNYARGKVYGVELSGNYHSGKVSAYANLARTVSLAKQVDSAQFNFAPDELAYIADHWVHTDHDQAVTASAGVSTLWDGTTLSADAVYGSGLRRGYANTQRLPSYVQVNLGASQRWRSADLGAFETRLSVVNLFDRVYELRDGSGIGVGAPQYGPRRGLFVGLSKLF
ncbi:MAG TPA: TonB-dependent receptor [Rhodocyclaceae bacterium]|nr:TonB-dependent receptor [Rhodocyclaceae bacterium]